MVDRRLSPDDEAAQTRPLAGLVVVDLTQFAAGPYCTMLLADAGARVIKIEPPGGEPYRHEGTPLGVDPDGNRVGSYVLRFNRDKESVVLDLKTPPGIDALRAIVRGADVLVQNFKPATARSLGVDYPSLIEVNPRLIYASVSGFGQPDFLPSPLGSAPAFAVVSEAVGGVMDRFGGPACSPHWSGVSLGDLFPGGLAVGGILMALHQRLRTGRGQLVDVAMADAMISLNERAIAEYSVTGRAPTRGVDDSNPSLIVRAEDGWVVLAAEDERTLADVCGRVTHADRATGGRPAGDSTSLRAQIDQVVRPAVRTWAAERDFASIQDEFAGSPVVVAQVLGADGVAASAQTSARRMIRSVDYGPYGVHQVVDTPIKFGSAEGDRAARLHLTGEDTAAVIEEFLGAGAAPEDPRRG